MGTPEVASNPWGQGFVPRRVFLTKGVGKAREKLSSFELALRNARIAEYNLVGVSSIFPPGCRRVSRDIGLRSLTPGQILFCVKSQAETNEPHRMVAASVGLAIPKDRTHYGYLSEHHAYGQKGEVAGDYAEDLAAEMLATILGLDFDPDQAWDEKRELWRLSGQIVHTSNLTQTAVGDKNGHWTTVLAAAVFCG
jgi:arginine decarboxylase